MEVRELSWSIARFLHSHCKIVGGVFTFRVKDFTEYHSQVVSIGGICGEVTMGQVSVWVPRFSPPQYHSTIAVRLRTSSGGEQYARGWPQFRDKVSPHRHENSNNKFLAFLFYSLEVIGTFFGHGIEVFPQFLQVNPCTKLWNRPQ